MICFCGDSYVEDHMIPYSKNIPLKNQWHRILTRNLYGDEYHSNYCNFGKGATSIDNLIEEQLIKQILPMYPTNPPEYLILSITYNERFSISDEIMWYPGMIDSGMTDMMREVIGFRLKYDRQIVESRSGVIKQLLTHFEKFGTKIYMFNVDKDREIYGDNKWYFKGKHIHSYIDISTNDENGLERHYSNHLTERNNSIIAERLYKEIIERDSGTKLI
jgi:hypothetical protein